MKKAILIYVFICLLMFTIQEIKVQLFYSHLRKIGYKDVSRSLLDDLIDMFEAFIPIRNARNFYGSSSWSFKYMEKQFLESEIISKKEER